MFFSTKCQKVCFRVGVKIYKHYHVMFRRTITDSVTTKNAFVKFQISPQFPVKAQQPTKYFPCGNTNLSLTRCVKLKHVDNFRPIHL